MILIQNAHIKPIVGPELPNGCLHGSLICHIYTHMLHAFYRNIPATELIDYIASLTQCCCSTSSDSGTSAGDKSCSFLF